MISRPRYLDQLGIAAGRSPVTALLGPRQCGKTTLARIFGLGKDAAYFDLESQPDLKRLQNPELVLGPLQGLVILDEIQVVPELFRTLRVLADRSDTPCRFLILGSASPYLIKNVSESLAGRVEFVELSGFDLLEAGGGVVEKLWVRGGFPRSFLADSDEDSLAWREGFIRTFLERDIPQLGITIWNASEIARSMGVTGKTVRSYLDILTGTYMVRQLQPWHENIRKRQVKAPKIYLRDSGLLHSLLDLNDYRQLMGHPRLGASWEGFAVEQILNSFRPKGAYFWATHSGAEIDLFFLHRGQRYGFEIKFNEAPSVRKSMRVALNDLKLDHLWVVYPGRHRYPVDDKITVMPLGSIHEVA